jgi:hypothetical protein
MKFIRFALMFLVPIIAVALPSTVTAQPQPRVFVNSQSTNTAPPSDTNPGASWLTAYQALQTGIARALQIQASSAGAVVQV